MRQYEWQAVLDDGEADDDSASLNEFDAADDEPIPPREWLLGNSFCKGFFSSCIAGGGTGKSALRYAQALSMATGRELTGEHVFRRCRGLIVSLEDDERELRRRIRAARLHYSISADELRGWLFLAAPGGKAGKILTADRSGRLEQGRLGTAIEKVIDQRQLDFVMLDPFVKSHSVEENNNSAVDAVVQELTDLCAKHNIAVDAPHHVSKGATDPGNANRGRGASSMVDAGRLVYTLSAMTPEEAEGFGIGERDRKAFVRLDPAKVNIAPRAADAKWFQLVGVPLGNGNETYPHGDNVQTVEPWTPPETWGDISVATLKNDILTTIDAGLPDGSRYTDAPNAGSRAAWKVIVEHAPRKPEAAAREIIKTWVKNGVLIREEYDNPATRKVAKGFRVDQSKRPE
jgi:hypothetical protein